jgi:hypothetical protein
MLSHIFSLPSPHSEVSGALAVLDILGVHDDRLIHLGAVPYLSNVDSMKPSRTAPALLLPPLHLVWFIARFVALFQYPTLIEALSSSFHSREQC